MVEHALRFHVRADPLDHRLLAPGERQIRQRLLVNRKNAHRRPVFRGHVGESRPVGQAQLAQARAVKLDEFANHAVRAEHLHHRQHQVRRRRPGGQGTRQFDADHFGQKHVDRLPQHHGLGLNAAHAPAEDAEAVDHRRVAVRAH